MSKTEYVLTEEFESFDKGTQFVRVAVYGESHIHDEKLETVGGSHVSQHVSVTEEQLEASFDRL